MLMGGFPTLKTQKLWSPSFSAMFLVCRTSQDDSKVGAAGRRRLPLTFAPSLECSRRFSVENDYVLCISSLYGVVRFYRQRTQEAFVKCSKRRYISKCFNWALLYNVKCLAQSVSFRETNSNSGEDLWVNLNKCLSRWWLVSSVALAVCQFSETGFMFPRLCPADTSHQWQHHLASAAVIVD